MHPYSQLVRPYLCLLTHECNAGLISSLVLRCVLYELAEHVAANDEYGCQTMQQRWIWELDMLKRVCISLQHDPSACLTAAAAQGYHWNITHPYTAMGPCLHCSTTVNG